MATSMRDRMVAKGRRATKRVEPDARPAIALMWELSELAEEMGTGYALGAWEMSCSSPGAEGWPPPSLLTPESIAAWVKYQEAVSQAEDAENAPLTDEEIAEEKAKEDSGEVVVIWPRTAEDFAEYEALYGPMGPPDPWDEMISRQFANIHAALERLPTYIALFARMERAWLAARHEQSS